MKKNLITGKKSKEKLEDLLKHDILVMSTKEDDEQFLKRKRKPENSKQFKLLFPSSDQSENDNDNLKQLNKFLEDDDNMVVDDKIIESNKEIESNEIESNNSPKSDTAKQRKKELLSQDFISFTKPAKKIEKPVMPKLIDRNYPWLSKRTRRLKGVLKLDSEIHDFYKFIKPTEDENLQRKRTYDIVKDIIENINPEWKVKKFGSFPNQIHLPDSDIDLIILTKTDSDPLKILRKISRKLVGHVEFINIIEARIPIIRATIKETKVNVDIR
jgi:hypothetical protein